MPAAKKKQKASWRTLSRRASEIERKNRGKPTKQSKALRTQAANLRRNERAMKAANDVAHELAVDALKTAIDATPPVPHVVAGTDPANPAYYTDKVHTAHELSVASTNARWEEHDKVIEAMQYTIVSSAMAAYEAHNSVHHNCVEPWVLTRAEMDAVMAVLKRSGYSRYGKRTDNPGGEMSNNLSDVRMAT